MRRRRLALAAVASLLVGACSMATDIQNGPYDVSVAPAMHTRLAASDAVAITRQYLDEQRPMLAVPDMHRDPHVQHVWALSAADARSLDGCIPPQASTAIVWVTQGTGDYLNLRVYPWSKGSEQTDDPLAMACEGPGPAGLIVIDDASGQILGVYPEIGDAYPHPTGVPTNH